MKPINQSKIMIKLILFTSMFFLFRLSHAQESYKLISDGQNFKVSGTSSLHDWHMKSNEATGYCSIKVESGSVRIIEGNVKLLAESLKSGKGRMDKNAYKALKTDENKWVSFTFLSIEARADQKIMIKGEMSLAGVTKEIIFEALLSPNVSQLKISGSTAFKLTDFHIDPPTALMGTIKTGDEVTIEFNATFQN